MGPKIDYEKDDVERENESTANVTYNVHDNEQLYCKKNCTKGVEKHCFTKYKTGCDDAGLRSRSRRRSSTGRRTASVRRRSRSAGAAAGNAAAAGKATAKRSPSRSHGDGVSTPFKGRTSAAGGDDDARPSALSSNDAGAGGRRSPRSAQGKKSRVRVSAASCYEVQRARRPDQRCKGSPVWQHGKYVRDECGSGIVPKRYDFKPSRRIWCKTPLSMYQATIGELARKILCREKKVPRDVRPAPPCNIEEYILPPCRGYYRPYDCLRPCEEEFARYKGGQKRYRDRVERYWEPCYTQDEKIKLDINEYAPQNAFLAKKMRRYNMKSGESDLPCW